ncbi:NAD(P)/FAD-dependent oxidoreductase [Mycobacterium sp. NAZ190054]|uniref:flavin-containing monooxygenase n=1 Tax=Mycobacterium sp. NAZ190054 TaxID=1747766 RepID=UPI0018D26D04|nr:NAD(P)/FAD-dependent oxidoreductase [Mycobacterium sp. NAZ190054]
MDHEAIVVGAGVCGIYQLHRLLELGLDAIGVEAGEDLGGTWFWNRYPGARFDSESVSYGYSFSPEILAEWDWKERFSSQPENLRYLNFVADKLNLRPHIRFNCRVTGATYDEDTASWTLTLADGAHLSCRFLITAIGLLSAPTLPRYKGLDSFEGVSLHTYNWPAEGIDLAGKRVGVIGTGATGVQVISAIAPVVAHLTVFQRRPNWCAPLHNSPISSEEMAYTKTRYDDIFARCARSPGGFIHEPDPRKFAEVSPAERLQLWERLYDEPGFGIWLANFKEIHTDEQANAELSAFIADKIRARVNDPKLAEKLIPSDHGFGIQRLPLETSYYETYNRSNVDLVDLLETPVLSIEAQGIRTTDGLHEVDVLIYATGFDAITGAWDRIDIRGLGGEKLIDKWRDGPKTFVGILSSGFPNMFMPVGPQSASATTNFPRGIEIGVDWVTDLIDYMRANNYLIADATQLAEEEWGQTVRRLYDKMLLRNAQSWFTGYNSNVDGHEKGTMRYNVYNGGTPRYRQGLDEIAASHYRGIRFA